MVKFRSQRGQSLLEFALLAPFVLFLLLALVDFGIAIDRRIVLDHAVREGARYASVGGQALTSGTPASIEGVKNHIDAQAQGISGDVGICYMNENGGGFGLGDTVTVSKTHDFELLPNVVSLGHLSFDHIVMNASASARAEYAIAGVPECPISTPTP